MTFNQGVVDSFNDSIFYQDKENYDELQIFVKVRKPQTEYDCV